VQIEYATFDSFSCLVIMHIDMLRSIGRLVILRKRQGGCIVTVEFHAFCILGNIP
jgi:hypothetical protein